MDFNPVSYGICHLSAVPLRKEGLDASEQVSQILFGEHFYILEKTDKWARIICHWDNYEAWISIKQFEEITKEEFDQLNSVSPFLAMNPVNELKSEGGASQYILMGSTLPNFNDSFAKIKEHTYYFSGKAVQVNSVSSHLDIKEIAMTFLNTPYAWGGRSLFGMDCSGFTQLVYKFFGIKIARDAYQQAEAGEVVNFITETKVGDLAFFDNEEGHITHVGIMIEKNKIIHASGQVRIDSIDHQGIFNIELKKYTHKLRIIKRLSNSLNPLDHD